MWNKSKVFHDDDDRNNHAGGVDNDDDDRMKKGCSDDDSDDDDSTCGGKRNSWKVCDINCRISVQTCAGVLEYLAMGVPTSSIPHYDNVVDAEDRVEADVDRQERLLTTALAILVDATSQGPDPLALSALGWAYGLGAGGGMGDWGACNYVPGDIGGELRELENTVSSKVQIDYGVPVSNYTLDFPATRFCTVGGLPPHKQPYAPGALWQPPIAGICVPSSCTSRDLFTLFGDDDFRDNLLRHSATIQKSFDSTTSLDMGNLTNVTTSIKSVRIPPAASRRYKYVSSLALSISTGVKFKMGIQCAGETGLAELDDHYMGTAFRGYDYWCTIGLVLFLACCVLIGTLTSSWANDEDKKQAHDEQSTDNTSGETIGLMIEENMGDSTHFGGGYGSTEGNGSFQMTGETEGHQKCGRLTFVCDCCSRARAIIGADIPSSLKFLGRFFGPFDATQSFYEITRMSRDSRYDDMAHQQATKTKGGAALDRAYSSLGLFPSFPSTGEDSDDAEGEVPMSESVSSSQCLNGMRSISMLWIILGHTIVVQSSVGYQNPMAVLPPTGMIASTPAMFFFSARYAVDTFFFIGGYLVMSGMLKKLDPRVGYNKIHEGSNVEQWMYKLKLANPSHRVLGTYAHRLKTSKSSSSAPLGVTKWFVPFILHRVLRILPTYGFVLLVWWKLAVTWGEGPFWPRWATFVAQCDKYAWTNMLFINNLVPGDQKFGETSECMYHAWYLGVDFQLCFVLTPIFVSLYLRRSCRQLAMTLEVLLVAIIVSMTFVNTYLRDWSGHLMDGKQTLQYDRDAYINPFYRAIPYLVGFITAQAWHEKSLLCPNLGLRKCTSVILSIFAAALMASLTFTGSSAYANLPCQTWQDMHTTGCGSGWPMYKLALFNSFIRPLWSLGLMILCLLGFNGQLHPWCGVTILNWAGWDPIAKLSFGMYLLHPMIINVWFLSRSSKFSYSHVDFVFLCAGIVTLTFISALLVGILVEWPMSKITHRIETWLWKGKLTETSRSKA